MTTDPAYPRTHGPLVLPRATVFFTADDDAFCDPHGVNDSCTPTGASSCHGRGRQGRREEPGEEAEAAVLKAVVDWFALQRADRLVYTYQFGKTAAESSYAQPRREPHALRHCR